MLLYENNHANQSVPPRKSLLNKRVAYPSSVSQSKFLIFNLLSTSYDISLNLEFCVYTLLDSYVDKAQIINKDGPPVFGMKKPPISPPLGSDDEKGEPSSEKSDKDVSCSALPDTQLISEVKRILSHCCDTCFDKTSVRMLIS